MRKHGKESLGFIVMLASALTLTGCQNMDTKDMLLGATAIGAAGAIGYYAGHHKKGDHHDNNKSDDRDNRINASSLVGESENQANRTLEHDGFHMVDGWQNDHGSHASYTVWFNESSGQCLKLKSIEGDIDSASDTRNDNCRA